MNKWMIWGEKTTYFWLTPIYFSLGFFGNIRLAGDITDPSDEI